MDVKTEANAGEHSRKPGDCGPSAGGNFSPILHLDAGRHSLKTDNR
jgi:hypothetical protein